MNETTWEIAWEKTNYVKHLKKAIKHINKAMEECDNSELIELGTLYAAVTILEENI